VLGTTAVALAVLGVALSLLLGQGGAVRRGDPDVPAFSFTVRRVDGRSVAGPARPKQLRPGVDGVRATLDAMYAAGFLDPSEWEEGTFPGVIAAFSGPAAAEARRDLPDLSLGKTSMLIEAVRPRKGHLDVRFLLGPGGHPYAAVARTDFTATARARDGEEILVQHEGRYLMRPQEGGWTIIGYQVDGELGPKQEGGPKQGGEKEQGDGQKQEGGGKQHGGSKKGGAPS
jgi:hypothetical protein